MFTYKIAPRVKKGKRQVVGCKSSLQSSMFKEILLYYIALEILNGSNRIYHFEYMSACEVCLNTR